jgi:hypothetical protein
MGCDDETEQLRGDWIHSFEEDDEQTLVFRRDDYSFPPSRRPRRAISLTPGGQLRVGHPGPADRREWTPGRWALDSGRLVLEVPHRDDDVLDIVSLDPDRLVVARRDQLGTKDQP